jgi:transcriptional regulator with XRE-family HTH domain
MGEQLSERLAALAANVRRLRESHGLSLAQVADRTGLTKATLFRIEARQTNPTLETLLALADAFSVSITDLLVLPERSGIEVVRAGSGVVLTDSAVESRLVKSMLVGSTLVEFYDNALRPGQHEVSMSHGPGAREHVLVRSGRVSVGPIETQVQLGPGDYATYPSDRPHRWAGLGSRAARVWVVHTFPRPLPAQPAAEGDELV